LVVYPAPLFIQTTVHYSLMACLRRAFQEKRANSV
jgi:hypothetical protein